MFTEELKGNASKKRQDQARERRRKLKQQQLKKQKENKLKTEHEGSIQLQSPQNSELVVGLADQAPITSVSAASKSTSISSEKATSSDAVANALEQRRIRSIQKAHQSATLTIQAAYRSYRCIKNLVQQERSVLEKRLSDLTTLTNILKKQKQIDYVPPTSLATALVHQLLFLTHTTPRVVKIQTNGQDRETSCFEYSYFSRVNALMTKDISLLSKILEMVLLPGILSNDVHLEPTIVWLESKEGRLKLKKLLRLICFVLRARMTHAGKSHGSMPFVAGADDIRVIDKFLRVVIGIDSNSKPANKNLVSYCRNLLLSQNYDYSMLEPGGIKIGQKSIKNDNLDLIHILRSFFLYPSCQKERNIIPPNADEAREKCILKTDRERADVIFRLILKAVMDSNNAILKSRFFAEVMTVPMFTWRIESATLSRFVHCDTSVQKVKAEDTEFAPFIELLKAFTGCFAQDIINGLLDASSSSSLFSIFPQNDVPLTLCPAPSVLCLFANMVQLGHLCPLVNGDSQQVDFDAAASYFKFVALLADYIPVATFSSRQSSVEWINDGAHLTPIVLSPVVLDQCKLILLDSYVRKLFKCAINEDALNVDNIIQKKDNKDEKLEKELHDIMTESLSSIAAKEAMVDRTKSFMGSKWARKLSKKFTSVFSNDKKVVSKDPITTGKGKLMDTTSVSRQLAKGSVKTTSDSSKEKVNIKQESNFNTNYFYAISRLYAVLLSRWGGTGGEDIVKRVVSKSSSKSNQVAAMSKPEPCVLSLLNVLCFSTVYVKTAWSLIQSNSSLSNELLEMTDVRKSAIPIRSLRMTPDSKNSAGTGKTGHAILFMFVVSLSHILIVTDDIELHDMGSPLPLHQIRRCILLLKNLLYRACCLDDTTSPSISFPTNHFGLSLIASSSKLMRDLHDRSSRRALCVPKLWLFENLLEDDIRRSQSYEDYCIVLDSPVLKVCPFLVSFKRRLKLFEKIVTSNRESIQGRNDGFSARPGVSVNITRGRVLEDGLIHLNKLGRKLRQRIIVQYINETGAREAGLDAGGLFKEFWTDLSALSFNLNYALFCETEKGYMYPNPSSRAAHGTDSVILFEFLGRILGKALYEGITIKPQFAHFFLSFLRGEYNFLHMLPDLSTMDQVLYNNLMFLKTYDGSAEDLCLSFTVANDDFGTNNEIELIPGGANIDVTDANKHRYIGLVAKHHVCDRVKEQSQAFTRGLWDVIDRSWLRIFNEPELQVLISGPSGGEIDVEDMKANSRYTGGYTGLDRNIYRFWKIVASLSRKQQADLLRFVTSCERPPPLGFGSLNPPFTIQRVGIMLDSDKLPAASTCFNILKLPTYSSEKVMRERLIYAIESGAGFELT